MMPRWFQQYANQTDKRWAEFKLGLGIFVCGVLFILAGARWWVWLQIPGLGCLLIGALIAAKGYLGILLYRLFFSVRRVKPPGGYGKDK